MNLKKFSIVLILWQVLSLAIFCQIPTDGLVAFYPFNGNANDESGDVNHGIVHGAALTSDRCGIDDKAFYFDGKDDFITVPHNFALSVVTICGWIKPDKMPQEGAVIFKTLAYDIDTWGLYLRNDIHMIDDIDDQNLQIYHTVINTDWHFFAAVLNDQLENKFYVDGLLVGSGHLSLDDWASYSGDIFIGQRGTSLWNGFFAGKIDDIRIYNRELSQDEVLRLFIYDCHNPVINIPNAFSPNGDGINDFFVIKGLRDNSKLTIFNRDGNQIFTTDNYKNDWDGKQNDGDIIETGTYWYILKVNGMPQEFKGFIYLKK